MSGTKKEHVKIILQTIENGTLSEAETDCLGPSVKKQKGKTVQLI